MTPKPGVLAAQTTPRVWAVVYGNYEPAEVIGVYATEALAQAEATRLGGMHEVTYFDVQGVALADATESERISTLDKALRGLLGESQRFFDIQTGNKMSTMPDNELARRVAHMPVAGSMFSRAVVAARAAIAKAEGR